MPIVTMPNGDRVNFPDTMSREEIRAKILEKFPEADPNRGVLQKWGEVGTGMWHGLAQDMGSSGRVLSHLPRGALSALPGAEPAAQLIRSFGPAAERWGNQPLSSDYERTGQFIGRDVVPMLAPGGVGSGLGRVAAEKATAGAIPAATLYLMSHFPHVMLPLLWKFPNLYSGLQDLAMRAAPMMGKAGSVAGHATERIGEGEAGQYIPGAPQNAGDTQEPSPTPPAPSSSPAVPAPAQPRTAPGAPRPSPGQDADTDAPVANRSSRGDRLNVYGGSAN